MTSVVYEQERIGVGPSFSSTVEHKERENSVDRTNIKAAYLPETRSARDHAEDSTAR